MEALSLRSNTPALARRLLRAAADFKASPLPPAPLDGGNCWLVDLLNWVTFHSQNYHFGDLEAPFGYPGNHVGDPGVHRDTQQPPLRSRSLFLSILGCIFGVSWAQFGDIFVICIGFGVLKWWTVSRSMFFGDPGVETMPEYSGRMYRNHNKNNVF